jgi:hypothetical protein
MTKIRYELSRLTHQTKKQADDMLAELPKEGGKSFATLDVVDHNGEIGHTIVYRGADKALWVRKGSPNPKDLYRNVRTPQPLEYLIIAIAFYEYDDHTRL